MEKGSAAIPAGLFYGAANLTEVTIPASVTSVGDIAFKGCSRLNRVKFGGNAPAISDSACVRLFTLSLILVSISLFFLESVISRMEPATTIGVPSDSLCGHGWPRAESARGFAPRQDY